MSNYKMKIKEDKRPQQGGWAPGEYINKCLICECQFIGDKRARHCADCAYDRWERDRNMERLTANILGRRQKI